MDEKAVRQKVRQRLDRLVEEAFEREPFPTTIDEIEALAVSLGNRAKQEIACELVEAQVDPAKSEDQTTASKWKCSCGRWAWYKDENDHDIVSMAGALHVVRSYYYCRCCDGGFCPLDKKLGLTASSYTLAVLQEVVEMDGDTAFAPGVRRFERLTGVSVSAKEAQRMLTDCKPMLDAYLKERETEAFDVEATPPPIQPDVLYVEADGVHTPLTDGWKETKIGLARAVDSSGQAMGPTQYVSHLGDCHRFGDAWYALAHHSGLLKAKLVVAIGDGAAWIWNQVAHHFPGAIEIVDYWHAVEHVWDLARAAYGVDSLDARCFVTARKTELWAADWAAFYEGLSSLTERRADLNKMVNETVGYFKNNQSRMNYARYKELGLSIGSGAAESGCKQVVTQRLKGAGMRWKEGNAQAIGQVRCLIRSDRWDAFRAFWRSNHLAAVLSP